MKKLDLVAMWIFIALAVIIIISSVISENYWILCLAFCCAAISWIAYDEYKKL
jgi:hypothetical protein